MYIGSTPKPKVIKKVFYEHEKTFNKQYTYISIYYKFILQLVSSLMVGLGDYFLATVCRRTLHSSENNKQCSLLIPEAVPGRRNLLYPISKSMLLEKEHSKGKVLNSLIADNIIRIHLSPRAFLHQSLPPLVLRPLLSR